MRIGAGAGGFVYRYKNSANDNFVALKISRKNDTDEQELIDSITGKLGEDYPCNIVPLQKLEKESGGTHPRKNFYVMPGMDGTLSDLLNSVNEVNKGFDTEHQSQDFSARLFHEIEGFIRCLNKLGYVYLDLKLEQILYHCLGENKFEIYIGDLGSLVVSEEGTSIASFPPPDACYLTRTYGDEDLPMGEPGAVPGIARNQDWVLGIVAILLRGRLSAYNQIGFYASNRWALQYDKYYGIMSIFHFKNCDDQTFNNAMKDRFFIEEIVNIAYPPQHFAGLNRRILDYLQASDKYTREQGYLGRASSVPLETRVYDASKRLPAYKGPQQKLHLIPRRVHATKSSSSSKSKTKSISKSKSKSKSKKKLHLEDFIPGDKKSRRVSMASKRKKQSKKFSKGISKKQFNTGR